MTCKNKKYCPHQCKYVKSSPCGKCGCECRCKDKIGNKLPVGGSLTPEIKTEEIGRSKTMHRPHHKVISIPYVTPSGIKHSKTSDYKKLIYS